MKYRKTKFPLVNPLIIDGDTGSFDVTSIGFVEALFPSVYMTISFNGDNDWLRKHYKVNMTKQDVKSLIAALYIAIDLKKERLEFTPSESETFYLYGGIEEFALIRDKLLKFAR